MIIFAKSDGTVIETKPTPFYQGSSLKGSIYLVAPFPNTNGVTIQFQLPNGNVTKAYPMTPTGEVEGVMLDGYEVSAWTWDVKNAMVTAIPGTVTATIKVIDTDDNVTSIVSSFSVIKGTPNALDVSDPSPTEWQAIISALGSIGGKVAKPLMTNFTYNIATGESEKTYNNGMVQTENFPAVLPDTMTEYQSFTKTFFESSDWVASDRGDYSYMLVMPFSTYADDFDIAVYSLFDSGYLKMNPFTTINQIGASRVVLYSNETYSGYALFFWKGSFAEQNYKEKIEKAIDDCEGATAQAENIANTLETAYENGELGIPKDGTAGQILTKTENGTAWQYFLSNVTQNANKTILVDGSVVNGNWNATFISQQGGKQRPICTQYTNHTGAKAEMVATANSAKFKFVNGSTDTQSYVEIFEDKINFSKPITVQGNPVGGGSGGGDYYITAQLLNVSKHYAHNSHYLALPTNVSKIVLERVVYVYYPNMSTPSFYTSEVNKVLELYGSIEVNYLNGVADASYNWLHDETIVQTFDYSNDGVFGTIANTEPSLRLVESSYFVFRVTP